MLSDNIARPVLRIYPDPILRQKSVEIHKDYEAWDITRKLREFLQLYNKNGLVAIGIAAPQIGENVRAFATQMEFGQKPKVYLNPSIWESEGFGWKSNEGCLSLPDIFVEVSRYRKITLDFMKLDGSSGRETFTGLECMCVQHELDHLNGKLIIDK